MLIIGIRQFFTRQNFSNPDSSKFSSVKIFAPYGNSKLHESQSALTCFEGDSDTLFLRSLNCHDA